MAWESKIIRIVRVRNSQASGTLARLLTAIADAGGDPGSIQVLTQGSQTVTRDITVYAEDEAQMERHPGGHALERGHAGHPGAR